MAKQKLRILCFGDSLTSGFASFGMIAHPYEEKLAEELSGALPNLDIETTEDGKPGDITGYFANRILPHFKAGGSKYDWTIILGGTNDLAYNYAPETIFENLQQSWDIALSHGSKVLALTVPEAGIKGRIDDRRNKLNELIKSARQPNLFIHDHHAAVPYWAMPDEERELHWDDHIHLTPSGYDLMGEKIAVRLLELVREQGEILHEVVQVKAKEEPKAPTDTASRPKRKKVFKDDDKVFDEEGGDSAKLAQGYVVVRKKDLD